MMIGDDRGECSNQTFKKCFWVHYSPFWPKHTCFSRCWYFKKFITKMPPLKHILYSYKKEVHRWGSSREKKTMFDNFFLLCCRWALQFGSFSDADCSKREFSEVWFLLRRVLSTSELIKGAHSSRPPWLQRLRLISMASKNRTCDKSMSNGNGCLSNPPSISWP